MQWPAGNTDLDLRLQALESIRKKTCVSCTSVYTEKHIVLWLKNVLVNFHIYIYIYLSACFIVGHLVSTFAIWSHKQFVYFLLGLLFLLLQP